MTVKQWESSEAYGTMSELLDHTIWVPYESMTKEEKERFPTRETTGGYLKKKTMHEAWADMWGNLNDKKKSLFTSLPNFDKDKFKHITGIEL